jgi:adenylate kinase
MREKHEAGRKTRDVQKTRDRGSRSALPSSIALMNLASMSSADDSEGTSVASVLSCHEKEAEIEVVVTMLEKDVS